ncbi:MAG: ClpXP protease specificity-enhancing factor [Xylophilus ampelinus]
MLNAPESTSTRPYLIRALYEWCCDNGLTPYVAVKADDTVQVPREFVKDGEIVLNISMDATSALQLGNDFIAFKARFGGVARDIAVPVGRVMAIFARENGQGMAFPIEDQAPAAPAAPALSRAPRPKDAEAAAAPAGPRVVQLVAAEAPAGADAPGAPALAPVPAGDAADAGDPPDNDPPGGPRTSRPALKRVK